MVECVDVVVDDGDGAVEWPRGRKGRRRRRRGGFGHGSGDGVGTVYMAI
jgi:hypothetical protein